MIRMKSNRKHQFYVLLFREIVKDDKEEKNAYKNAHN